MPILMRLLLAVAPILLSVLFMALVMEGHINLGGGEKDIFLALPLGLWSLVYLFCFLVLWWRRFNLIRSVVVSAALTTGVVVVAWLVLAGVVWFRFR